MSLLLSLVAKECEVLGLITTSPSLIMNSSSSSTYPMSPSDRVEAVKQMLIAAGRSDHPDSQTEAKALLTLVNGTIEEQAPLVVNGEQASTPAMKTLNGAADHPPCGLRELPSDDDQPSDDDDVQPLFPEDH